MNVRRWCWLAVVLMVLTTLLPAYAQAPVTEKWCSGVRIVFFPGGPAGGVFANNVYNGAKQAESDLGPKVDYVFSDWDPQKMIAQFKEATAMRPDGIAIMGHGSQDAWTPLVEEAEKAGIIVTTQNVDLPDSEKKYSAAGMGYSGAHNYSAGVRLGAEAVKRFELKSGDRAAVWGMLSQPSRGERTKGVLDALKEAGLTVDYFEIDQATNADPPAGTPQIAAYISSHPDVKMIITDHGGMTATLETYLKGAGKGPDDILGAGFDMSPATLAAVRGGWTDLVIDQQPWLQGYIPVLQVCLTKKFGFSGLHVDTAGAFVDKNNIEALSPLVEKEIR